MNDKSPNVLAVIPARGGSKGIPKKNIIDLCGKPLIYYSIREAHKSKLVDATILSTDSPEIADVAKMYGVDVPFLRPSKFASDSSRDVEYLAHAIQFMEQERGWTPKYVVLLLPTTPSRIALDIDAAIEMIITEGADSVRTMTQHPHFNKPHKMWKSRSEGSRVEPLFAEGTKSLPRQELPICYMPVAAAYVTQTKFIKEGRMWGDDVRMMDFPLERFTDIDTMEDLTEAAEVLKQFKLV